MAAGVSVANSLVDMSPYQASASTAEDNGTMSSSTKYFTLDSEELEAALLESPLMTPRSSVKGSHGSSHRDTAERRRTTSLPPAALWSENVMSEHQRVMNITKKELNN